VVPVEVEQADKRERPVPAFDHCPDRQQVEPARWCLKRQDVTGLEGRHVARGPPDGLAGWLRACQLVPDLGQDRGPPGPDAGLGVLPAPPVRPAAENFQGTVADLTGQPAAIMAASSGGHPPLSVSGNTTSSARFMGPSLPA